MPCVNLQNDLPVFRIKHDVGEVGYGYPPYHVAPLQGVAFAPRLHEEAATPCAPNTLGDVWAIALMLFHVTVLRSFGNARLYNCRETTAQRAAVEGVI